MAIDMHSHWFPKELIAHLSSRSVKPRIFKKDGVDYLEHALFAAPLEPEDVEDRIAQMDKAGVERAVISLTTVFGV